ncbi:MAG: heme biosynthesis protein HemY [Candidatus Puniceispirillales bacterium]
MLRRLVTLAILIVAAGFLTSFLIRQPGVATLDWLGYRIEIRTSLLVMLGLGVIAAVVVLDRLIGFLAGLPLRLSRGMKQRRSEAGQDALALGLVAASVGDRREAARQEKKARKLIGDSTLTNLLTAQVATLDGKTDVASRYFSQLADDRETAYFGQAGLMRLGLESGDDEAALAAGREAFARKKDEPSLARALFALEARRENWPEAITALAVARKSHHDEIERRHADMAMAVLHFKYAESLLAEDQQAAALSNLEKGLKYRSGLVPAAMLAARLHQEQNSQRKAVAILEKAFLDAPHPDIAAMLMAALSGDEPQRLSRLMHLADKGGNRPEALVITATWATKLELWGEALRLIRMIDEDDRDAEAWSCLADIARHAPAELSAGKAASGETDWPEAEACLTRAATAPRGPGWHCRSCGMAAPSWNADCSSCKSFASIVWRRAAAPA